MLDGAQVSGDHGPGLRLRARQVDLFREHLATFGTDQGAQTPAGHTDILVSYVYRIAFESGRGADYGFAAAIAVLIFIMVAGISAYSFKYTRTFEEIA